MKMKFGLDMYSVSFSFYINYIFDRTWDLYRLLYDSLRIKKVRIEKMIIIVGVAFEAELDTPDE